MKASTIFAFAMLIAICHASQRASVKVDGVEMVVEFGYINGADTKTEALLDGNVYLKNISDSSVSVVTGPILGPRYATSVISYIATTTTNSEKARLKPSLGVLDVIELKPGEVTMLKHFQRRVKNSELKMIIAYNVDKSVRDFYPSVWSGDLIVNIALN
jgi:hypothetical protein